MNKLNKPFDTSRLRKTDHFNKPIRKNNLSMVKIEIEKPPMDSVDKCDNGHTSESIGDKDKEKKKKRRKKFNLSLKLGRVKLFGKKKGLLLTKKNNKLNKSSSLRNLKSKSNKDKRKSLDTPRNKKEHEEKDKKVFELMKEIKSPRLNNDDALVSIFDINVDTNSSDVTSSNHEDSMSYDSELINGVEQQHSTTLKEMEKVSNSFEVLTTNSKTLVNKTDGYVKRLKEKIKQLEDEKLANQSYIKELENRNQSLSNNCKKYKHELKIIHEDYKNIDKVRERFVASMNILVECYNKQCEISGFDPEPMTMHKELKKQMNINNNNNEQ